ncbi:TonB-dependent receptor [Microbulbifer sp. CAU 1566]|uniref:TonB-dependent receptor n=1 Tax=Microbulbifer sp. CAU 1566 TaxID=2933269 RepID=UPI0020037404|nr:TonB-dependent receptor [Microbulbifer sp. CAU 1566]MCK7598654.1 TonB-dependent receptor [Microbulbifer sp. CAU 1566]
MKHCHHFLIASGLLFFTNSLSAAVTSPDDGQLEQLTVTGTRELRPSRELAESLSVVDRETLQSAAPIHPSQVFSTVPGALVSRGNGQESLIALRSPVLTGAGSCGAFAITQDGVPVRGTGFCNVNQLFDTAFELGGRIEVLRGPGTVLYGSDAQHGVINVLSEAPANGRESSAVIEGGANDYQRIKLQHSRGDTEGGFRIGFSGSRDGGYKHDAGYDQQKLQLLNDSDWRDWSMQTLVSLANLNQETAGYVTGKDTYKDKDRKRENPNPEAFRESLSARIQVQLARTLDNGNHLQLTPYVRHTNMEFLMHFLPGTPVEENGQQGLGVQSAYRHTVNHHLELSSGIDLEYTDAWLRQTQDGGFSVFPEGKHYDYSVTAAVAALFSHAELNVNESTTATLGARTEYLHYQYDNHMIGGDTKDSGEVCSNTFSGATGCRYSRPDDRSDSFSNLSVNTSLLHHFTSALTATLRIAHGFRAPQSTELYRLQNGQTQADLDSEEIDSFEFGFRGRNGNGNSTALDYSLTGFYMKKSNVVFQSSDRLNLNSGESRHYGLEYALDWTLTDKLSLNLAGTFARHLYTSNVSEPGSGLILSDGNDIDTAPRQMHSATVNFSPMDGTRLALQWQSMGSYFTDIENAHRYTGHDLLHLRLLQSLRSNLTLGLRIENLTNTDYAERADFSSLGGGDRYFIGEPRSIYGDIRFNF